ncbi:MAG: DUF1828 domain-containing protein, partial [Ilumatobacteraceae bacterium]
GDHLAVILKREGSRWILTDEGHTYMHLTYDLDEKDFQRGNRQKIISNALSVFSVEDKEGELRLLIPEKQFGDGLFSFVQALLKISDVSYLSRERVKSTFLEDFRRFMEDTIPAERRSFDWHDPQHDPAGMYIVDCRLNGMLKPIMVFALPSDDRVRDATISMQKFELWHIPHRSLAIFEDQEEVNRKVLARFSDTCEKQFSSLGANKDRIATYLAEAMAS